MKKSERQMDSIIKPNGSWKSLGLFFIDICLDLGLHDPCSEFSP